MAKNKLDETLTWMQSVTNDPVVRQAVTKESFLLFFLIYFAGAIEFPLAPFHREMIDLAENQKQQILVIMAFRNCGKSTIMNTAYALYSILGKKGKKFVVIMSKTKNQARIHFENIKNHLENNELLKHDLGPFKSTENDFGSYTLEIPNFGAKIISISSMQGIRGMKYGNHRPDLIILDDIEDTTSVSSVKNRDTIYKWFLGEVVPAGDRHTDIIVLGNLLHPDSLLMRLKKGIDEKTLDGTFRAYPLLDDNEKVLWPGKFQTYDDIELMKKSIGDELVWKQEYLLTIGSKTSIRVWSFRRSNFGDNADEPKKEKVSYITPTIVSKAGYVISAPIVEDECKIIIETFKA